MSRGALARRRLARGAFWTLVAVLLCTLLVIDWYELWPLALVVSLTLWAIVAVLLLTERKL